VAEVLDDLLGLSVTPGTVDVPEGMQCASGDALGGLHHPVESPVLAGGAIALPRSNIAQQNNLGGATVEVCEVLRNQAKFWCRGRGTISGPQRCACQFGGVLSLPSPVEVIFQCPLCQGAHLVPVLLLLLVIRPTTVVSSANLMIELESFVSTQSCEGTGGG
jgi:hypothetical protein